MNITATDIQKAFEMIPENLKEAVLNTDISGAVSSLGNEYHLHVDVLSAINNLTLMVCIGLLPAADFVSEIKKAAPGLSNQELVELIGKINSSVFEPIRQHEEHIAAQKKEEEEFERIAQKYSENEESSVTSTAPVIPEKPITLSDIKSAVKPIVADQKKTLAEWKATNVIKTETQKSTIENYKDAPDPYKESV